MKFCNDELTYSNVVFLVAYGRANVTLIDMPTKVSMDVVTLIDMDATNLIGMGVVTIVRMDDTTIISVCMSTKGRWSDPS